MVPACAASPFPAFLAVAALVAVALAGCAAVGGPDAGFTTTPTATSTATERVYDPGIVHEILDGSDRVAAVLVNDTYTYRKGCIDESDDAAVSYIRTGFRYVETDDGGRKAVGGSVYRVEMALDEREVTSVEAVERMPDGFVVRGEC